MTENSSAIALKELAYRAIARYMRQILVDEYEVFQDRNLESLQSMLDGVGRLCSAIVGLAPVVNLPASVTANGIATVGQALKNLRDSDVLLAKLIDDYRFLLPAKEQKILDRVIKSLTGQRRKQLKQVRKTINSSSYLRFKQELRDWLDTPAYYKIGSCSVERFLPDLLLSQVSHFWLQSGWLIGTEIREGTIYFPQILNQEAVNQLLAEENGTLRDLQKSAETTYYLELFTQFYGDTYQQYLDRIEQIRAVLRQIQDTRILRQMLAKNIRGGIAEKLPELSALLLQTQYQKWSEWQTLQQMFLEERTRREFVRAIIINLSG